MRVPAPFWFFTMVLVLVTLAPVVTVRAQNGLTIEDVTVPGPSVVTASITVTNAVSIRSFTLAVGFDASMIEVLSAGVEGTVSESVGAELVFPEIFPTGGFILGVFLDVDPPFDGQLIPPGSGQPIANFELTPVSPTMQPTTTPLMFVDDQFGSPTVENTIFDENNDGIGVPDGLQLTNGTATLEPSNVGFRLETGVALEQFATDTVAVLLDNDFGPAEGFTVTLANDGGVALESIDVVGTEAEFAETIITEVLSTEGTITVIVDGEPPFDGQTIATGTSLEIAKFGYTCTDSPLIPEPDLEVALTFTGTNSIIANGTVVNASTEDGSITCSAVPPPDTAFSAGGLDGNPLTAAPDEVVDLHFFVQDLEDDLQGFQMAVELDCNLSVLTLFDATGTITETAEFVDSNFDNDPTDGDGCELVIGVLFDSFPPFDGQTVAASPLPIDVGRVPVRIASTATVGSTLEVTFPDAVDGAGAIDIENIAVIDFNSVEVVDRTGTSVTVVEGVSFVRGDTNGDGQLDIADCIRLLSQTFEGVSRECDAASDIDANGALELTDFFLLADHLFLGGPSLAAPYPDCGVLAGAECSSYDACP